MSDYQALALAFRTFFEQTAETTARQTKFVLRRSKLTGAVFVQTLVLGSSEQPEASLNDLAEMAADLGVAITAQGLDERINSAAVTLFETLCQESLRWFQQRVPLDIAVLRQFTAVWILDSSCIALPATLKETYPGSGGDGPAACLKVQLLLNFLTGDLEQIVFQTGCDPDQAYEADLALLRPGVLRLSDLGYFKLDRLKAIADRQAYFLTRLDLQTTVQDAATAESFDLLAWLQSEQAVLHERQCLVGASQRLPCRLIAVRLPREWWTGAANGPAQTPGARASARSATAIWPCWPGMYSSATCPPRCSAPNGSPNCIRCGGRWSWSSNSGKASSPWIGSPAAGRERVLCELYAKLIATVLLCFLTAPHRLTLEAELSLIKAAHIMRRHVTRLAQRLAAGDLQGVYLRQLSQRLQRFAGKTKRRKTPSTLRQLEQLIPPGPLQATAA